MLEIALASDIPIANGHRVLGVIQMALEMYSMGGDLIERSQMMQLLIHLCKITEIDIKTYLLDPVELVGGKNRYMWIFNCLSLKKMGFSDNNKTTSTLSRTEAEAAWDILPKYLKDFKPKSSGDQSEVDQMRYGIESVIPYMHVLGDAFKILTVLFGWMLEIHLSYCSFVSPLSKSKLGDFWCEQLMKHGFSWMDFESALRDFGIDENTGFFYPTVSRGSAGWTLVHLMKVIQREN
jgi:hypothetical protein